MSRILRAEAYSRSFALSLFSPLAYLFKPEITKSRSSSSTLRRQSQIGPNIGKIYKEKIPVTAIILNEREAGWITSYELLKENTDTLLVINSATRSSYGIEIDGEISHALWRKVTNILLLRFGR
jgi:hypothetical protein